MKKREKSGGGGREERTVREWRREGRSREEGGLRQMSPYLSLFNNVIHM